MAYVADRVAPHEKIRRVEFVTEIPKSPSGKILRRLLADATRRPHLADAGPGRVAAMTPLPGPAAGAAPPNPPGRRTRCASCAGTVA